MEKMKVCKKFELHPTRKLCLECNNPKEDHSLTEKDITPLPNLLQEIAALQRIPVQEPHSTYAWVPPTCPKDRIEDYFKEIPESMVPVYKSEGQKTRLKMLFKQIPVTDLSEKSARFVTKESREDFEEFVKNMKNKAVKFALVKAWESDMPIQCMNCLILLETSDLVVVPSMTSVQAFHPGCFVCSVCKDLIVDLTHCVNEKSKIFCVRHYSDTLKNRCHGCDELIFASEYAQAKELFYHSDHLRCFAPDCNVSLEGNRGYEKEGEIYCSNCFEKYFADYCNECEEKISIDEKHMTDEDKCWHLKCFTCELCGKEILDFEVHETKYYCIECYNEHFAPRCKGCKQLFEGENVTVLRHQGKMYHHDCFKCDGCKIIIGTEDFIPNGDNIYCKDCYVNNFEVKCFRCKKPITDEKGIMCNKQPYHTECFICLGCSKKLRNDPFKTVEGNWYCMKCYEEKFSRLCHACDKRIIVGDKDVLYAHDEYRWHPECLQCRDCLRSLKDSTFTMQGKLLLCKDCAIKDSTKSTTSVTA